MRFTKVTEEQLKNLKRRKKSLKYVYEEFIRMHVKIAKVELTEFDYNSVHTAYNVLSKGARVHCVPVRVSKIGDEIYFIRTDI